MAWQVPALFFKHSGGLLAYKPSYRWRVSNVDQYSALMVIEQWEFFNVPHILLLGHLFIMVISEEPWHSHLVPSVRSWSCYYLFLRHRSLAAWIQTRNLPRARRTLYNQLCQRGGLFNLKAKKAMFFLRYCIYHLTIIHCDIFNINLSYILKLILKIISQAKKKIK